MSSNTRNNVSVGISICLMLSAWVTAGFVSKEAHEPQAVATATPETCDVVVISVDVGNGPFLFWSNHEAQCGKDGTVTVQTECKGDSR